MDTFLGNTKTFKLPSGYEVTIREQNGGDDDVISNASDARTNMNLSKFIAGLVTDTDITENRKLTVAQAHSMPSLDRYAILFHSRIHSLGDSVEFDHDWGADLGGSMRYEQDLHEYLFEDYSTPPTDEEVQSKPNAIPYYPNGKQTKDIELTTNSGKRILFDLLTAEGEAMIMNLPADQYTKNKDLEARNVRLVESNGEAVKITRWNYFSSKEMIEIRRGVLGQDPNFKGTLNIENPNYPGVNINLNIVAIYDFFYPGEI